MLTVSSSLFFSLSATVVILTAARAGHLVDTLIHTEMENSSGLIRYNAILRFELLWRFRYQFWIRLEEDAHSMMKVKKKKFKFQFEIQLITCRFFHQVLNLFYHQLHLVLLIFK
jgi:hypothetical protein